MIQEIMMAQVGTSLTSCLKVLQLATTSADKDILRESHNPEADENSKDILQEPTTNIVEITCQESEEETISLESMSSELVQKKKVKNLKQKMKLKSTTNPTTGR